MSQTHTEEESSDYDGGSIFMKPWIIFLFVLATYICIELIWYWYIHCCISPSIQHFNPGQEHAFKNPIELLEGYFTVLKEMGSIYPFQQWISGWFHNVDFNEIYSENVEAAFAWAVYTSHLEDLEIEKRAELIRLRKLAEKTFDFTFPDGYNEALRLKHACMDLEPVKFINKPLILYALLNLLHAQECWKLREKGFQRYTSSTHLISYWFKEESEQKTRIRSRYSSKDSLKSIDTDYSNQNDNHYGSTEDRSQTSSSSSSKGKSFDKRVRKEEPILLIHGITRGFGYLHPLIDQFEDRAIILIEYPCIWFSWITLFVNQSKAICDTVGEVLETHNISTVCLIGHSWGTFLAGWIVRKKPELVTQIVMCDPISMCVWLPDTTYTILYKPPLESADYLLYYFVRNDISVSHTLHRNFAWYNMSINLDEIPSNISIVIANGGKDKMIHAGAVKKIIEFHQIEKSEAKEKLFLKHLYYDDFEHGKAAIDAKALQAMKQAMIDNEEDMKLHGVFKKNTDGISVEEVDVNIRTVLALN